MPTEIEEDKETTLLGMSKQEIIRLVNQYIGVSGGYLGDFSYRTHREFYPEYCDLDIDPQQYAGTTRERFILVLENASPGVQARIIRGTLAKFPPDPDQWQTRTQGLHDELLAVAQRLEGSAVNTQVTAITSSTVERAIRDAETLIRESGATSGVDRVHTLLHGYLKAVCDDCGIAHDGDASMTVLFKRLREQHPAFAEGGPRGQDVTQVLRGLAQVMDALNPIRNNASMAHPNEFLLGGAEAMLVINAARTVLHYLDLKLTALACDNITVS